MTLPGILIAFEGIDGAGKTTQVELLGNALRRAGEDIVLSKEPTDGEWGRKIRASAQSSRMPLDEELHAFIEDRKEHIQTLIQPSLAAGKIVILDRYYYSTIAYQGARGKPVDELIRSVDFAPRPDIVILIDIDPSVGIDRISGARNEIPNEFERHESLTAVRQIFRDLAKSDELVTLVDGSREVDDVYRSISDILIQGVLKQKRCAKQYPCDPAYCSIRLAGNCRWAAIVQHLPLPKLPIRPKLTTNPD